MGKIKNNADISSKDRIKSPNVDLSLENYDKEKPVFSFHNLHSDYSIENCTDEEKSSFLQTMLKLSKLTWESIKQQNRHALGFEKIDRNILRCSLPSQVTDEVKLIAFRFYNKAPMVGYREKNIFHIIFFDRNYKLYNHGK